MAICHFAGSADSLSGSALTCQPRAVKKLLSAEPTNPLPPVTNAMVFDTNAKLSSKDNKSFSHWQSRVNYNGPIPGRIVQPKHSARKSLRKEVAPPIEISQRRTYELPLELPAVPMRALPLMDYKGLRHILIARYMASSHRKVKVFKVKKESWIKSTYRVQGGEPRKHKAA
jgi:hypothetical protein